MDTHSAFGSTGRKMKRARLWRVGIAATVLLLVYVALTAFYPFWKSEPGTPRLLNKQLAAVERDLQEARAEIEMNRVRHEVDRKALELVRVEMAAQKEHTADLEENLRFYRSLMAPEGVAEGIRLRVPELVLQENTSELAFRIVVQQEARKHALLRGKLKVKVSGELGGEEVTYSLTELSQDLDDSATALQFRYFQSLEGKLTLPEGFEPSQISVVAAMSKPRKVEVQEQFPWHVQERFTHVGK
ncbi:MAG: hypothetical protein ACI9JM_001997 [Halioglobus sp.]|jgi:hypothetical protein